VVPAPLIYETVWTFICIKYIQFGLVLGRVFNATFNNITVISWRSALLVEETEYMEKTTDLPQVIDKFPVLSRFSLLNLCFLYNVLLINVCPFDQCIVNPSSIHRF
jgi:hypothetical protein